MKYYILGRKINNLQWRILYQQFLASFITVAGIIAILFIVSGIIVTIEQMKEGIEIFLGFSFFSVTYFTIMLSILLLGTVISVITTIYFGYPFSNWLKEKLQSITEASDAFSRGKLDYRIPIDGCNEIDEVSSQFNNMANLIEKQVSALQDLVTENTNLVNQIKSNVIIDERRKLATELHDAVSQQLFAISMNISSMIPLMQKDSERAEKTLEQIEGMVEIAQLELRALIMHLRPVDLDGISLCQGIEQLLNELEQKHPKIKWNWELNDAIDLSRGIEDQIFRIIQESVSNMLRHSEASNFNLKMSFEKKRVLLFLEDDGQGMDLTKKKKSSYGLQIMRERVEGLGGRFDIISYPGKGTRIEIRIPLPKI